MKLIEITRRLAEDLSSLSFEAPVAHVYNPLRYAWEPHERYLRRYGKAPKKVVLIGMNPGPWGMAQTGVPFGEVGVVREWLGIEGAIGRPDHPHPKRPVTGFACGRSEVSGRRLWGWARERYRNPERFFRDFFVLNYCPLIFFDSEGRNLTPDKLPAHQRARLFALCDGALAQAVACLKVDWAIGVGRFAEQRARVALSEQDVTIGRITHPSPANPKANRGWSTVIQTELGSIGVKVR